MQRVLRAAPATIAITFVDQNGAPVDPAGLVTVGVTRANGTVLVAAGAATVISDDTGVREYTLSAAETGTLDMLTATWTDAGSGAALTTQVAIVGGFLASLAELRDSHKTLSSPSDVSDDRIYAARQLAELECERCTGVSFVPAYSRVRLAGDGTYELYLPNPLPTLVRSVRSYTTSTEYDTFTATQLAAIVLEEDGRAIRTDEVWRSGRANIVIETEHGATTVPYDIHDAVMRRTRHFAARREAGIPARANTWTAPADAGGGTYQLNSASRFKTGDPEVDAVYEGYSELFDTNGNGAGQNKPISRPFDFDPQYDSLFHGGRR